MTRFDTFVAVDWSGGRDTGARPRANAIWAAVARAVAADDPVYLRNRAAAETWLGDLAETEAAAGRRVLIGFDFPFGYPAGLAGKLVGRPDPLALWDWFAAQLPPEGDAADRFRLAAEINRAFPGIGPFWFNGLREDLPDLPRKGRARDGHGLPERREVESLARGTLTCWQMGGAGSVGAQAMTGMASLSRLRALLGGRVSVWPFQRPDASVVLAEIWPSLIADAIEAARRPDEVRDAAQVRVVATALARMQSDGTLDRALDAVPEAARREEGWILGVGAEDALRAAAAPPRKRVRNDCFALPPGVSWTPVDEALARLRQGLECVVGCERVPVAEADGRVLAEDVVAQRANPPAANSAVDGYGFAHDDRTLRFPLVEGRAAAGEPFAGVVPAGRAVRVLTGAILPPGVDTVVLQEDVELGPEEVALDRQPRRGANVRSAGEDVEAGATALAAGHLLRPPDLALVAALGVPEVAVRRRLRVAVLSTGDELAEPGATADPARTYDANRPMLLAVLRRWGHEALDYGHLRDDRAAIRAALDRAAGDVDAVLTSGGASAGDEDHVSALLREAGAVETWRVAVKPGRPLALGLWGGVPVFGLPGNPVAAFVCTLVFARPALSVLAGAPWAEPQGHDVPAAFRKSKKAGRREYLRARLRDGQAEVFASEGSGRISGLSWADGLVELGDEAREVGPGDIVRFLPYAAFGL